VAAGISGPAGTIEAIITVTDGHATYSAMASGTDAASGMLGQLRTAKAGDVIKVQMVSDDPTNARESSLPWLAVRITDLTNHQTALMGKSKLIAGIPKLLYTSKAGESSTTEVYFKGGGRNNLNGEALLANVADTHYTSPNGPDWGYYLNSIQTYKADELRVRTINHKSGEIRSFKSLDAKAGDYLDITMSTGPRGAGTRVLVKDVRTGKTVDVSVG
jgi:hypothetical protein